MPFVPGVEVDVFLSYSWADDQNGWVANFHKALLERVHVQLGRAPEIWRDKLRLDGAQDFTEEIQRKLGQSAAMVLIVSPSYATSQFCRLERKHFAESANHNDVPKAGTRFRAIKAIKSPLPASLDRKFMDSATGFVFHGEAPDSMEFSPGEQAYQVEIHNMARGVKAVLEEIANARTAIYIAEPVPPELESVWKRLRGELQSKGFRVLPDFRLDDRFFNHAVIAQELNAAAVSVHLATSDVSAFAQEQLRTAQEIGKPVLVWVQPGATPEAQVEALLASAVTLRGVPSHRLEQIVLEEARKLQQRDSRNPAPEALQNASIYLICDRTDPVDNEAAAAVAARIAGQSGMTVHLPETGRDPAILDEIHQKRLTESDAVLFYQGSARSEWFVENYTDLLRATRKRAATASPIRATGILLGPGAQAPASRSPSFLTCKPF
mgnify:CR=1 FL=1